MVMVERPVHLITLLFVGKLEQAVNQYFVHILSLVTDYIFLYLQVHCSLADMTENKRIVHS